MHDPSADDRTELSNALEDISLDRSIRAADRHRDKIERALEHALDGSRSKLSETSPSVWFSGPAGVGKSAVLDDLQRSFAERDARFVVTRGFGNSGEILEPVSRAVRELIDVISVDSHSADRNSANSASEDSEQNTALADALAAIIEHDAPALDAALPEIDWETPPTPLPSLQPKYECSRLIDHLCQVFLRAAAATPIVLVVESADLLDTFSKRVLQTLVRIVEVRRDAYHCSLTEEQPPRLAFVFTTEREDGPPPIRTSKEPVRIVVRGLGRDAFAEWLTETLDGDIPLSVREKLYQKTRGNPLELMLRFDLIDTDDSPNAEARCQRMIDLGTVEDVVRTKLQTLSTTTAQLLSALAIATKPVPLELAADVAALEDAPIDEDEIDGLIESGWLKRLQGEAYVIASAPIIEPLLAPLSARDRRELHARYAECIADRHYGRQRPRRRETLTHARATEDEQRFITAAIAFAEEAERLFDVDAAIETYLELLPVLDRARDERIDEVTAYLLGLLPRTERVDGEILESLQKRLELRTKKLKPEAGAKMWRLLGHVAETWCFAQKELYAYQRALTLLADSKSSPERTKVLACLARCNLDAQHFDKSLDYCREGLEVARLGNLIHDPEYLELCRVTLQVYTERSEFVEALRFEKRYLGLARQDGGPVEIVESLLRLAQLCDQHSTKIDAEDAYFEARDIARSTGSRLLVASAERQIGNFFLRAERWEDAYTSLRSALAIETEIGNSKAVMELYGEFATICFFAGRDVEGVRNLRRFSIEFRRSAPKGLRADIPGWPFDYTNRTARDEKIRDLEREIIRLDGRNGEEQPTACLRLADLLRDRGQLSKAKQVLRKGQRAARRVEQSSVLESEFALRLGILHAYEGNASAALTAFQSGVELFGPDTPRALPPETRVQLGVLHLERGAVGRARVAILRGIRGYLEAGQESGIAHALVPLAQTYRAIGRFDIAASLAECALSLSTTLRLGRFEAEAWLELAKIRSFGKSARAGLEEARSAHRVFSDHGILEGRCRSLIVEADIRLHAGELLAARTLASKSLDLARDLGMSRQVVAALVLRGEIEATPVANRTGDLPRAISTFEQALEDARSLGSMIAELEVHAALARVYRKQRLADPAKSHLSDAKQIVLRMVESTAKLRSGDALVPTPSIAQMLRLPAPATKKATAPSNAAQDAPQQTAS